MSRVPFHQRVQELRTARGMSLRQMAQELEQYGVKVSHNAIAKWEQEKSPSNARIPSQKIISALCKLFNVRPSFLIEEMFRNVKTEDSSDRLKQLLDVELLTEDEFSVLVNIKDLLIAARKHKEGSG